MRLPSHTAQSIAFNNFARSLVSCLFCKDEQICSLSNKFCLLLHFWCLVNQKTRSTPLTHCKKSYFWLVKSTGAKLKVKECNVLFIVILFCIIFAKEIIFVLSSIMVLVCKMAFAESMIHILEWMRFELLCTNVLLVGKIGKVLFSI